MKKTVKRHWDHVEVYPLNPEMMVVLSCGHRVRFKVERIDGAVKLPPQDGKFDCAECAKSWRDNLKAGAE